MLVRGWLIATDRMGRCLEFYSAKHLSVWLYWSASHTAELELETQMCAFPIDFQETGSWYTGGDALLLPTMQN